MGERGVRALTRGGWGWGGGCARCALGPGGYASSDEARDCSGTLPKGAWRMATSFWASRSLGHCPDTSVVVGVPRYNGRGLCVAPLGPQSIANPRENLRAGFPDPPPSLGFKGWAHQQHHCASEIAPKT